MRSEVSVLSMLFFGICTPAIGEIVPFTLSQDSLGGGSILFSCSYKGITEQCLFDSGSARSIISRNETTKTLPSLRTETVRGVSGKVRTCDVVLLDEWTVGQSLHFNVEALRCEHTRTAIGIDFFGQKRFSMSFSERRIVTGVAPPSTVTHDLRILPSGHLLIYVNLGGENVDAVLDTATSTSVIDQDFVTARPDLFSYTQNEWALDSAGTKLRLEVHLMRRLKINNIDIPNSYVLAADLSVASEVLGPKTRLIVGANHMRHLTWFMDLGNRKWTVTREAKRGR